MEQPKVSFVIPCYKLAHLLRECVGSILLQTYPNFEILIMDDCSPDNTSEVVASLSDERVRYVRNESNLGHLRNYNKGIQLARGKYVWLISADDYLRRPYVLKRYVEMMERNPQMSFVFCPAVGVRRGQETNTLGYSIYSDHDRIVDGHKLLRSLLRQNFVVAASAMARRKCYDDAGYFPLETTMQWSGDWYLWCVFSLQHSVGYLSEPMVCYREHELSMTSQLIEPGRIATCSSGDIAVPWMVRDKALKLGCSDVADVCLKAAARQYERQGGFIEYRSARDKYSTWHLNETEFESSLSNYAASEKIKDFMRSRYYLGVADGLYHQGKLSDAKHHYLLAIGKRPWMARACLKLLVLFCGRIGQRLRNALHIIVSGEFVQRWYRMRENVVIDACEGSDNAQR